jgi:hypothetical protein
MRERLDQIRLRAAESHGLPAHVHRQDADATAEAPLPAATEHDPGSVSIDEPVAGLQPGQRVPARPEDRITEPRIEPRSVTGLGMDMTVGTRSSASFFDVADLPNGDEIIELDLPERLPVIDLLDLVGKYLNLSYIYDPQKVTGEVTVKLNGSLRGGAGQGPVPAARGGVGCKPDLVMTRHKGNIVRIVPKVETMNNADPKLMGVPGAGARTRRRGDHAVCSSSSTSITPAPTTCSRAWA